jgi:dihydroxyacetone kinase-like protein
MAVMTGDDLKAVFQSLAQIFNDNKEMLCDLDNVMGDGDIGLTMSKGFVSAAEATAAVEGTCLGDVFKAAAMAMIKNAPSTMGTLIGSGFLKAAAASKEISTASAAELVVIFEAFVDGIQSRGKAARGDKTILDSLGPAVDAMNKAVGDNRDIAQTLDGACEAAGAGVEEATALQAKHGRAAWFGEGSIGKKDPGTVVGMLIMKGFAEHWS